MNNDNFKKNIINILSCQSCETSIINFECKEISKRGNKGGGCQKYRLDKDVKNIIVQGPQ